MEITKRSMKISKDEITLVVTGLLSALIFMVLLLLLLSCNSNQVAISGPNRLSDINSTERARLLYNRMKMASEEYIMVGHQDALAYGMGWRGADFKSDIHEVSGEHPAVFGWDLGHISDAYNIDSVPFDDMKHWSIEVDKRGGINTYSWHPLNLATGGNSWDISKGVSEILPGAKYHEAFMDRLDLVAGFFTDLKDESGNLLPVIFRPWHEMNGGWFWWGSASCTPREYKTLWRFTVDYLRNNKGLHNIIYTYSTDVFETKEEYLRFYPGDEYVDILGYDDYKGLHDSSQTFRTVFMLETLSELSAEKNKLYTISEGGLETLSDSTWFTHVVLPTLKKNHKTLGVSYILFWRNGRPDHFYAPYPGHASASDFIQFKNDTSILLLNGLNQIFPVE